MISAEKTYKVYVQISEPAELHIRYVAGIFYEIDTAVKLLYADVIERVPLEEAEYYIELYSLNPASAYNLHIPVLSPEEFHIRFFANKKLDINKEELLQMALSADKATVHLAVGLILSSTLIHDKDFMMTLYNKLSTYKPFKGHIGLCFICSICKYLHAV